MEQGERCLVGDPEFPAEDVHKGGVAALNSQRILVLLFGLTQVKTFFCEVIKFPQLSNAGYKHKQIHNIGGLMAMRTEEHQPQGGHRRAFTVLVSQRHPRPGRAGTQVGLGEFVNVLRMLSTPCTAAIGNQVTARFSAGILSRCVETHGAGRNEDGRHGVDKRGLAGSGRTSDQVAFPCHRNCMHAAECAPVVHLN